MSIRAVAIIPARMASSRFPGKPLTPICGLSMIEHVRRRVGLADVDEVVVATCDQQIRHEVERHGGRAIMTGDHHECCTGRVAEALESIEADVVLIVQGDEPLLDPAAVDQLAEPLRTGRADCANLVSRLEKARDFADVNVVKAVTDRKGRIMYFSRAPIPHFRERGEVPVYRQIGIMGFSRELLLEFERLDETPLERAESVDLLRLLEHGRQILAVPIDRATIGVDHLADVARVEACLQSDPLQRELLKRTLAGG